MVLRADTEGWCGWQHVHFGVQTWLQRDTNREDTYRRLPTIPNNIPFPDQKVLGACRFCHPRQALGALKATAQSGLKFARAHEHNKSIGPRARATISKGQWVDEQLLSFILQDTRPRLGPERRAAPVPP